MDNLFLELIKLSLGNRKDLSKVPTESEWSEIYEEAERQGVVGILMGGVERLSAEHMPPFDLKLQWIGEVQMMESEYRLHFERAKELTNRFRAAGFSTCVLKGIGLAQLYPNPSHRQCGDIDLWTNGSRQYCMKWLRSQCDVEHIVWHHADMKFFEDVASEIHFHPMWLYNPLYNWRIQRWFKKETNAQMYASNNHLGFAFPTLTFNVIYSLIHTFHHFMGRGVGMRHILDYYYIVLRLSNEERVTALKQIRYLGLERFLASMMWVLQVACGMSEKYSLCEPNAMEGRFLLEDVMQGGNFGFHREDLFQRSQLGRKIVLLPHYPREILWVFPWKIWHRIWRLING